MRELVVGLASGTDPCNMSHTRHAPRQGSYRSWKSWKVLEFYFGMTTSPGKSWRSVNSAFIALTM